MPQEHEQNSVVWPQGLHDDPMTAPVGDDDFSKFLDLEADFQFTGLDNGQSGLDTPMGRLGFGQHPQQTTMHSINFQQQQQQLMNMDMPMSANRQPFPSQIPTTQNFEPFQQFHHMPIGQHYHVPPTPVSSDMHPAKYGQHVDNGGHLLFDRHQVSLSSITELWV
jgi:hypothetical protein